jgi:hypothetical protein
MNAFQLLKNDHQIVSGLFDQIESASGKSKDELFARLKLELDVHAEIEETIFYPALENKQESREITLEAYEEHKVVKDLLAELANGKTAEDDWDAKLKVLRENVDHHVEEEEGELFDKADDVLSDERLEQIGNEMEAAKARKLGLKPPARAGRVPAKRRAAKSAGSRKRADSPGVLKRLANFVGLADSSSERSSKSASKSSSKGSKKKTAAKSASKAPAKKSGKQAGKKAAGKAVGSRKSSSKKTGAGSRSSSRKSTKRSGGSKRKGASKKR